MKSMYKILFGLLFFLVACQKEVVVKEIPKPVGDDFLQGQYNLQARKISQILIDAPLIVRRKEKLDKFCKKCSESCIYLKFDGDTLPASSYWVQLGSPNTMKYSGLTSDQITKIVSAFKGNNAFGKLNVTITTDPDEFYSYPPVRRQMIVFTESWEWYGKMGGVSYVNSRSWGTDEPAFVFSSLLGYDEKKVGQAGIHEAGHQLSLQHQCDWRGGVQLNSYSAGLTPDHAPFMGIPYSDPDGGEWIKSPQVSGDKSILNLWGVFQNDWDVMVKQLGEK